MKKFILHLFAFCLIQTTFAQITLEHTYEDVGDIARYTCINFTNSDQKYIWYQETDGVFDIKMYNLDHSLFKDLNIDLTSHITDPFNTIFLNTILNVSDNIFDTDDDLEMLFWIVVKDASNNSFRYLIILNEDDSEILIIDQVAPNEPISSELNNGNFITAFNTNEGLKMMVKKESSDIQIYSLPGVLPDNVSLINEDLISLNNYPNPAGDFSIIEYSLPENETNATLFLFDQSGKQIYIEEINENKGKINFSTNNLNSGFYTYVIKSKDGLIITSKVIVVR